MSSHEPEPDDGDTGPLHADSIRERTMGAADRRFDAPLSVNPRPVQHDRRPVVLLAVATVAVVGLGVIAWSFWPSSGESEATGGDPAPTSTTQSSQQSEARLFEMLPDGYDGDDCEVVVPPKDALAQFSCTENTDPGGPLTASYTLARDTDSLRALFDGIVETSSVVDCPGNIQSPVLCPTGVSKQFVEVRR